MPLRFRDKIEQFLAFTDLDRDNVIGKLLPDNRLATVWNVAVNGVMAGCRPEYMPLLVAIVEVMCDPEYGMKHGGSTPGWEAMIVVNGPIRERIGLDCGQGLQRPGNQANTSIGRFYRLFARNVPGFLPGTTDMATFGQMFRAVIAENDEACRAMALVVARRPFVGVQVPGVRRVVRLDLAGADVGALRQLVVAEEEESARVPLLEPDPEAV